MHHGLADTGFQSTGIHLPLHTASGGIIRMLDDSSPFVPETLTSINMTTQAGRGTDEQSAASYAGGCDVGSGGRAAARS